MGHFKGVALSSSLDENFWCDVLVFFNLMIGEAEVDVLFDDDTALSFTRQKVSAPLS